jgi:hypothetical protein
MKPTQKTEWSLLDENGKLDLRTSLRDPKTGQIYASRNYVRISNEGEVAYYKFIDGEYAGQVYTEDGVRHPEKEDKPQKEVANVETERTGTTNGLSGNGKRSGSNATVQPTA